MAQVTSDPDGPGPQIPNTPQGATSYQNDQQAQGGGFYQPQDVNAQGFNPGGSPQTVLGIQRLPLGGALHSKDGNRLDIQKFIGVISFVIAALNGLWLHPNEFQVTATFLTAATALIGASGFTKY
jgi:hypothetical protein